MSTADSDLSPTTVPAPLLTVEEVSLILKCAEPHVRKLVLLGLLGASRIGIGLRIRPEDLNRFLEEHRAEGPDPRRDPHRNLRLPTGKGGDLNDQRDIARLSEIARKLLGGGRGRDEVLGLLLVEIRRAGLQVGDDAAVNAVDAAILEDRLKTTAEGEAE